jgi:hypothetical protein
MKKTKALNFLFTLYQFACNILHFTKPRIYVYTDSRGYDVNSKYGKTPWGSYIHRLLKNYRVDYCICPEKYTTIVDFIAQAKTLDLHKYKAVILHCGVVDFSPRPLSNIALVKESKAGKAIFDQLFQSNASYYANPYPLEYMGEPTINLYSLDYLQKAVLPFLTGIPQLIWINSNHFVKGWEGNYEKGRPANIDALVSEFDYTVEASLQNIIDIKGWNDASIQKCTIDNIHFTTEGFQAISQLIHYKLKAQL